MATNRQLQEQLGRALGDLQEARALYLQTADQTYAQEHAAALERVHRLRHVLGYPDLSGNLAPQADDYV